MEHPLRKFTDWLDAAKAHPAIAEPTAMTLATATREGVPSARIVLLKGMHEDGLVFYTNLESRKSNELKENPNAALCFYWMPLERQVRIEGAITQIDTSESDAYFASRARSRQIGAWASDQSRPLVDRGALEERVADLEKQYPTTVPRPPHWGGWLLTPHSIEFWQQNWARLHARELYTRNGNTWSCTLLYP